MRWPSLEPRLFSFNSPQGACPSCDGLGLHEVFDVERVVAFPTLSLASGAIKGWDRRNGYYFAMLESLGRHYKFDIEQPYESLPEAVRQVVLYGSGDEEIAFKYEPGQRRERRQDGHQEAPLRRHPAEHDAALPRDRFEHRAR